MAIVINGSGTVSGISVGGLPDGIVDAGTLATNSVDSAELIDGAVDDSHMAAMAASKLTGALPAISGASLTGITTGKILQVVQALKTDTFSSTHQLQSSPPYGDITGLSVAITPSASSSKILVRMNVWLGSNSTGGHTNTLRLMRDSTAIGIGDAASSRQRGSAGQHGNVTAKYWNMTQEVLDSPNTTSATTYKVQGGGENNTWYINRSGSDADNWYTFRLASSITVMEIGA